MTYQLTPELAATVTDVEMAFSTKKLLPEWADIPGDFKTGNRYTALVSALFYGQPLPDYSIEMKPGFEPEVMRRATVAHLKSFAPKHEHKIAGVGYLVSCMCTIHDPPEDDAPDADQEPESAQ